MKKAKTFFILGAICAILTALFTLAVSKIDVSTYCYSASQQCESIGFSSINLPVNQRFSFNQTLYDVTELAGLVPIVFALVYGFTGITQLFKRKSLFKVNHEIIALGGLFGVAFGSYILFNKFAVNYRPVLMNGELESSFPSSHTMLILCICFGIIMTNLIFYKNIKRTKYVNAILVFFSAFIVVGRFLSGAHWATDIIGGLFYAGTYLLFYEASLRIIKNRKKQTSAKQSSKEA